MTDFELDGSGIATTALDDEQKPSNVKLVFTGDTNDIERASKRLVYRYRKLAASNFYFDLETTADESRLEAFGLAPIPEPLPITPAEQLPEIAGLLKKAIPAIVEDLAKINPPEAWLGELLTAERGEKNRAGVLDAIRKAGTIESDRQRLIAERQKLLAVTPEFCRIKAIGWAVGEHPPQSVVIGEGATEEGALELLWGFFHTARPIVGFNVLGFDLPVIFIRSALLGVPPTRVLDLRPWGGEVCDLMKARFPAGSARGLKELCRLYGIPIPAGEAEGSQVVGMSDDELRAYVESDVAITRELHRFYQGYFCK